MSGFSKLVLKPTVHCFHKCKYCDSRQNFYESTDKSMNGHMDLDFAKKLINDAYHLGMKECLISGGDPLLYPHLIDLIYEAKKYKDVFVYMNSVGTRLTEEYAKKIFDAGLGAWNISLDSPYPDVHNKWRGVKTAWSDSIKAVEILSSLKKNHSTLFNFRYNFMAVITRYNYRDIPQLMSLAIEKGAASVHLMKVYGDDVENNFLLSTDQIVEFKNIIVPEILAVLTQKNVSEIVLNNAENLLRDFYKTSNNSLENYAKGVYWNDLETVKEVCNQPDFYSLVEPTGDVLPCCLVEISHIGIVGNALKKSLTAVWNGEQYQEFRDKRMPFCIKCPVPYQRTIGLIPEMCRRFNH